MSCQRIDVRARAVLWILVSGLAWVACGTPQEGGPRRTVSDDDGGTDVPMTCEELRCEEPATCIERFEDGVPQATCSCPRGFAVQGNGCADVDECARPEDNDCDEANGVCENRNGGFSCRCRPGFALQDNVCKSLDTCVGAENTCHPAAACALDATGGTMCSCGPGFEGDGRACVDIDECAMNMSTCADNAHCINTQTGFSCACDTLFTGDGRVQCRDRCEAAQADPAKCDPGGHGRCVLDATGNASCTSCTFEYTGDGVRCSSNAECGALDCGANTVCGGDPGARECECAPGFTGDPTEGCTDVNECASGAADCDSSTSQCLNVPGSFVCECKPGFEWAGGACVNINECDRELDRCDQNAECSDKTPGYSCTCKPGYQLQPDGLSCADIDECKDGTAECRKDDKSVMCVNTRGSYECRCPAGFAGDGAEGCYCDLSGAWAVRQDATLVFPERAAAGQSIVAESVTYASIWELHRYQYDGEKIVVERKTCGADVWPEIYSPLYGETYSSATPNMVQDRLPFQSQPNIPLPKSMALPGTMFTTPRSAVVFGIRLDDPLNDEWPQWGTDVPDDRWLDPDDDGEPGISLWPASTLAESRGGRPGDTYSYLPVALEEGSTIIARRLGCASVALRTTGSSRVNIDRCDRLLGTLVDTKAEGRVKSCTLLRMDQWNTGEVSCTKADWTNARGCEPDEVRFLDEQDQDNTITASFEMLKLGGLDAPNIDCAAVRAKLPAIPRGQ